MTKYYTSNGALGKCYYRTSPTGWLYYWNEHLHRWTLSDIPIKDKYDSIVPITEEEFKSYMVLRELVT